MLGLRTATPAATVDNLPPVRGEASRRQSRALPREEGTGHVSVHYSSVKADWRTPPALFQTFSALAGGFTLDAAADADNHLCHAWFGPGSSLYADALTCTWGRGRAWLNPPYGRDLPAFVAKAVEQVSLTPGLEVWMLVPARTDTRWWQLAITRTTQVWFLAGRVKFVGATAGAPFPSAVLRLHVTGGNPSVTWGFRA